MSITVNKEGYVYIFGSAIVGIFFLILNLKILTFLAFLSMVFFILFFRDPSRITPDKKNIIVAPSDGKVIYVDEIEHDEFLKSRAKVVRIFMSLFDVHVNRAPVSGSITSIKYNPGKFTPAFLRKSSYNEKNHIKIKFGKKSLVLVQIAGFLARRIRCWVKTKDKLEIGQKVGLIKFGSGTMLIMPKDVKVLVKEGDKVRGGETVIATWR